VNGDVKQGYLFPTSQALADTLHDLLEIQVGIETDEVGRQHTLINGETDRLGTARYRVEQPMLRRRVLAGRRSAECDLCGDVFPDAYLVAAHIKKRASTTDAERRDLSNIMLACTFGCDAAFEAGALRVSRVGKVYLGVGIDPTVQRRLAHLVGRAVPRFDLKNRKYFAARESSFS
jgi:hypothetical protein